MKAKSTRTPVRRLIPILAVFLIWALPLSSLLAQAGKDGAGGKTVPQRVPLIIKNKLVELAATATANDNVTEPGSSSAVEVTVGAVPSGDLVNGKLVMRFQAFKIAVGVSSAAVWKVEQASTSPIPAANFDSGAAFTGNNEIALDPNASTEFQFQLSADEYGGEADFMMIVVGRAALPAGTGSRIYEAAMVYIVRCPQSIAP